CHRTIRFVSTAYCLHDHLPLFICLWNSFSILLSLSRTSLSSSEVKSFGNSIISLPLTSWTSFSGLFQRWMYSTSMSLFFLRKSMYKEGEASKFSYQLFV